MRNIQHTLSYRWMERVWNNSERTAIRDLLSDDAKVHGLNPDGPVTGVTAFEEYYDLLQGQLKGIHVEVNDVIVQDDMEANRITISATEVTSGKKVSFTGQCIVRIKDDKIAEAWNNIDFLGMYLQAGFRVDAPESV